MAEELVTGSIAAPGFSGLNTQDSSIQLDSGFALEANNCVIDRYGRIGARKGWTKVNSTAASTGVFRSIYELVTSDGNVVISAANNKIYTGTSTLTEAVVRDSTNTANITYTISDDNWQIAGMSYTTNASDHAILAQEGHPTLVYHKLPTAGSGATLTVTSVNGAGHVTGVTVTTGGSNWYVGEVATVTGGSGSGARFTVSTVSGTTITGVSITTVGSGYSVGNVLTLVDAGPKHNHTGSYGFQRLGDISTLPTGYSVTSFTPNCIMTAYGRVWAANISGDTQTVYFSDLLDPSQWQTGTAGSLDISKVVPNNDPIVALAAHNGFLIIFCTKHIVIYRNPTVPANLALEDVITGVGCLARDSVASIATDLLFLASTGVHSLQRIIQEKSLPYRDVSKNVRDELITLVSSETLKNIKAVYFPTDAFYLLSLPSTGFTYCFDTRGVLQNGAARTTVWKQLNPTAFCVTQDRQMYIGKPGYIGKYELYEDNGDKYRMSYFTNYFDFGSATTNKILKRINVTAIGGSAQPIAIKWGYDYTRNYFSRGIILQRVEVWEYGTAEYNIATYTNGIALDIANIPASGSGTVLQLGFESDIDGTPLSIQKIDFFLKQGKTL